jgi:hypothetical protein
VLVSASGASTTSRAGRGELWIAVVDDCTGCEPAVRVQLKKTDPFLRVFRGFSDDFRPATAELVLMGNLTTAADVFRDQADTRVTPRG